MDNLIDGRTIAATHRKRLKGKVAELHKKGVKPSLVIYYLGNNPAAERYFNAKLKLAEALGIVAYPRRFERIDEDDLIRQIENCDDNCEIDGIFVELPLPGHFDVERVREAVVPHKDVDGINPTSLGQLMFGEPALLPATPTSVIELLRAKGVALEGVDVVVVGRSEMVGVPLALLLQRENATVTVCHGKTKNLAEKTRRAEIVCAAMGHPNCIRGDMVRDGAVVVDLSANVTDQGVVGDVNFGEVQPKAKWITPVPGGVGPMAATMVMANVVKAARRRA